LPTLKTAFFKAHLAEMTIWQFPAPENNHAS